MKQPEDNKTIDFIGGGGNTPQPVKWCVFWIQVGARRIEWRPLTKTQAVRMHRCTGRTLPAYVSKYGWEEID